MSVKEIATDQEFQNTLRDAGNRLVVVDFFATWCGPCQIIAPFIKQLSAKYPNVHFLKVDVDKLEATAQANRISAMPTFVFFKNSAEIERIRGADKNQLEDKVKRYANESSGEAGGAATAAGTSGEAAAVAGPTGYIDLAHLINKTQSECLNQSDDHTWENVLINSNSYLQSDCDEQLILSITFNQQIKLHSLIIQGPSDKGPKTVKIFTNQTRTLDFDSAEKMEAIQQLDLKPEDLKDHQVLNLRFVKFQNVNGITLFFPNNQSGSDTTVINYIKFIGIPVSVTNMSEFKRVAGQAGEAHG